VEVNDSQRWSSEVAQRGGFAGDALSSMREGEEEDDAFPLSYTRSGIGLVGWSDGLGQVSSLLFSVSFLFLFVLLI
jgi:hypothetical protein